MMTKCRVFLSILLAISMVFAPYYTFASDNNSNQKLDDLARDQTYTFAPSYVINSTYNASSAQSAQNSVDIKNMSALND
jgi:hypothetical protein